MLTSALLQQSINKVRPCAYTIHDFGVSLRGHLQTDQSMRLHTYMESFKAGHLLRMVTYIDGWSA